MDQKMIEDLLKGKQIKITTLEDVVQSHNTTKYIPTRINASELNILHLSDELETLSVREFTQFHAKRCSVMSLGMLGGELMNTIKCVVRTQQDVNLVNRFCSFLVAPVQQVRHLACVHVYFDPETAKCRWTSPRHSIVAIKMEVPIAQFVARYLQEVRGEDLQNLGVLGS